MNREDYETQKATGVEDTEVEDAAQQEDEVDVEDVVEEDVDSNDTEETEEDADVVDEDDDLPELPKEQQTAFQKRLEREQKKIREKAEQELKEQYDQQYSKHKSVIDMLGGDPDKVEKMIRDRQMQTQIEQRAKAEGWTPEQTQFFIQQQQKDAELQSLKIQVQINELKDDPNYTGIGKMKDAIVNLIEKSNHSLTAEQAYWALGGRNRAEQLRREAEQREIAKRNKPKRTVQKDSPTSTAGDKPLSPEDERIRKRLGLSVKEAQALLSDEETQNLETYRKKKARK